MKESNKIGKPKNVGDKPPENKDAYRKSILRKVNEKLKEDIQYKYFEQPKFMSSQQNLADYYFGVRKSGMRYKRLKAYEDYDAKNGIKERLQKDVQPVWEKWSDWPEMYNNLFDDQISKEVYDNFVEYLLPTKVLTDTQEAQNAVLALTIP